MAAEHQSLKGHLLLDGGNLRGSFFHRTVVLICEHSEEGAMGLVLNRTTDNEVGDVIEAELPDVLGAERLFLGGPVQPSAMSYLYSEDFLCDSNVIENLKMGHSLEDLIELGESFSTTKKVRVFAGYAGWSPGQLESEMARESWLTHPASLDLVFHRDPESLWRQILWSKGGVYRILSEAPEDLSWN